MLFFFIFLFIIKQKFLYAGSTQHFLLMKLKETNQQKLNKPIFFSYVTEISVKTIYRNKIIKKKWKQKKKISKNPIPRISYFYQTHLLSSKRTCVVDNFDFVMIWDVIWNESVIRIISVRVLIYISIKPKKEKNCNHHLEYLIDLKISTHNKTKCFIELFKLFCIKKGLNLNWNHWK